MALHDPSSEEQRMLGNIVYDVIKATLSGNETFTSFSRVIGEKIDSLHQNGIDTQYLVEVKKGLLALGDFFQVLKLKDVKQILPSINISTDISMDVQHGITQNMSKFEKAQYQAFLAVHSSKRNGGVIIDKSNVTKGQNANVENITILPDQRSKASWLQDTFSNPQGNDKNRDASSFAPKPRQIHYKAIRAEIS